MNVIVSDANERQELDTDYVDPEPELEHLRVVIDADKSLKDEAQGLLDNLPAHRVLFCPVADLDLEPLRRVGHLADTFVLCDWRYEPSGFDETIGDIVKDHGHDGRASFGYDTDSHSYEVPAEQVQAITGVSNDFGLFHEPAWVAGQEPWCRITRLGRRSGDVEHRVWLVYIVGDAIQIYQRLFVERGAAPTALWLNCPVSVDVDRWGQFISPDGEFGRVFSKATRQPKYVAAQRRYPGWHQTVLCQRLPGWHPAWDMNLYGLPDSPAV